MSTGGSSPDYSQTDTREYESTPFIQTVAEAETIFDGKDYKLRDMYFTDKNGFVQFTIAITNLKAGQQTKGHIHHEKVEMAFIERGEGLIILDGVAHRVNAGKYILIDVGVPHKLINLSLSDELIAFHFFQGFIVRQGFTRKKR